MSNFELSNLRTIFSNVKKKYNFKTSQNDCCAKYVSSSFKEDDLVNKTVFVIDDVNIFFDYGVFKVYATNDTYPIILNHILSLVDTCIQKHGYYHFHMDLNTFSVRCGRYKQFIEKFVESCINSKRHTLII
jgi:hypothetical protein